MRTLFSLHDEGQDRSRQDRTVPSSTHSTCQCRAWLHAWGVQPGTPHSHHRRYPTEDCTVPYWTGQDRTVPSPFAEIFAFLAVPVRPRPAPARWGHRGGGALLFPAASDACRLSQHRGKHTGRHTLGVAFQKAAAVPTLHGTLSAAVQSCPGPGPHWLGPIIDYSNLFGPLPTEGAVTRDTSGCWLHLLPVSGGDGYMLAGGCVEKPPVMRCTTHPLARTRSSLIRAPDKHPHPPHTFHRV